MTEQSKALAEMHTAYGPNVFTEDHEHYRRVGFRRGGKTFSAIGATWRDAIDMLAGRMQ
jgi:hypothetical protein